MRDVATGRGASARLARDRCLIRAGLVPHHVAATRVNIAYGVAAVGVRTTRSGLRRKATAEGSVLVRLAASGDVGGAGWIANERRVAGWRDRRWPLGQAARVTASIDVWRRKRIGWITHWSDVRLAVVSKDASVNILIGATNDGDGVHNRIPRWQRHRIAHAPRQLADLCDINRGGHIDALTNGGVRAGVGGIRIAKDNQMGDIGGVFSRENPSVGRRAGWERERCAAIKDEWHQCGRHVREYITGKR